MRQQQNWIRKRDWKFLSREQSATDVLVGKVSKPHGIKGQLKIYPYSGSSESFQSYSRVMLTSPDGQSHGWFDVTTCRSQGKFAVIAIQGIDNRTKAEAVAGFDVWVDRNLLPLLTDDEYYWQDLIGKDVVTVAGMRLGKVSTLVATGAHDVLVVSEKDREYMIPAIEQFVLEVNEDDVLVVNPPEGLLEINL